MNLLFGKVDSHKQFIKDFEDERLRETSNQKVFQEINFYE